MKRLTKIKSTLAVISLLASSTAYATSTLSHNNDTNQFRLDVLPPKIKKAGKEYYRYDDMLIPVDKFSTRSQFDLDKNKWTDGIVYYAFAADVSEENKLQFIKGTEIWTEVAQLTFVERTDQPNFILVENGSGNFATVGMVGGQQTLTMSNWGSLYVVVHELGHSLGMWHEQQRADRDDYVQILEENIEDNQKHNFTIKNTTAYGDYDFLSVMHYPSGAWSKNGLTTIEPKAEFADFKTFMGQRSFISGGDQHSAASHYGAKTIEIIDPNFKSYLVENFDLNQDGEIDSLEAAQVKTIQTPGNGEISSIEGIKYFRFLHTLNVANENLSSIPALPNHLVSVDFSNNQLTALDTDWVMPPMLNTLLVAGNMIDEYSCEDARFIEQTMVGDTFTYSPNQAGESVTCDESAQFVLFNGKTRYDLRSKSAQTYFIDVPANTGELKIETTNFEEQLGGEMDIYVANNRQPSSSDYDFMSNNQGNNESVTIPNPTAGRWQILLQPTERSFEYVNLTASFGDSNSEYPALVNGETVSGLSGAEKSAQYFVFDLAEDASSLVFDINGGSGDADLYVRFGEAPTLTEYDCRPWKNGNNESCEISNIQTGRYYVMVYGYTSFQNLNLVVNYSIDNGQQSEVITHNNLSGNAGNWMDFPVEVPAGMGSFNATISGGSGDADLYVRYISKPTTTSYNCRPYQTGNNESCAIANPQAGTWYVSLRGYTNYSGVNLVIEWKP